MDHSHNTFTYSIVTPEMSELDQSAESMVVPAHDGELGILPLHAPLIAKLQAGEMRVTSGGKVSRYFVKGGFVQVLDNKVSVITTEATPGKKMSLDQTRKALSDAEALPSTDSASAETRREAIRLAKLRLKVAEGSR